MEIEQDHLKLWS